MNSQSIAVINVSKEIDLDFDSSLSFFSRTLQQYSPFGTRKDAFKMSYNTENNFLTTVSNLF